MPKLKSLRPALLGRGLVLAPGFIDAHSHHDGGDHADRSMPLLLALGMTTIAIGHDGESAGCRGRFLRRGVQSSSAAGFCRQERGWSIWQQVVRLLRPYGDPGSVKTDRFIQTMSIKSRVAAVNHYPAGQAVAYDRTYRPERESWLANIPLGYSDGYRRGFSHANRPEFAGEGRNRSEVLIGGRRFPIVGRVTMNTLMVDVTDAKDTVRLDDEVVLFGAQGPARITQAEFEANGSAYAPEMLAVLGATLPPVLKERAR